MTGWSACIEMLFAEHWNFAHRIGAAKAAGFDAVEFWRHSNKDLPAIRAALDETGLPLAGILCEPICNLTDPQQHARFLDGVVRSRDAALALGTKLLIAQSGNEVSGPRPAQHAAVVTALTAAADVLAGSGVIVALEPLNDWVDHKGYFVTSTAEGLDIVDEVGRPEVRLLYDIYHAAVMGEDIAVLKDRVDRIAHVHLADAPGRGEPGSGRLEWQSRLAWLRANGYAGLIGLEYKPTRKTEETLGFIG